MNSTYPLRFAMFIIFTAASLFLVGQFEPVFEFYAGFTLILLCLPGFMIGLMLSLALSIKPTVIPTVKSTGQANYRVYHQEIALHFIGILLMVWFVLHFLSRFSFL